MFIKGIISDVEMAKLSDWKREHSPKALDTLLSSTKPLDDLAHDFVLFGSNGSAETNTLIKPLPMTTRAIYAHLKKQISNACLREEVLLRTGASCLSLKDFYFMHYLALVLDREDKRPLIALVERGQMTRTARVGVKLLDESFESYRFTPDEEARLRRAVGKHYQRELLTHPCHSQNDVSFIMYAVEVSRNDLPLKKFLYERMEENHLYQLPVFLEHERCPRIDTKQIQRIMEKHPKDFSNDIIVSKYIAEWSSSFLPLDEVKKRVDAQIAMQPTDSNDNLAKLNRMAQIDTGTRYLKKYHAAKPHYQRTIASFCSSTSYVRDSVRPVPQQSLLA